MIPPAPTTPTSPGGGGPGGVLGVGVDVVGVERFTAVLARDDARGGALRRRLFDDDEADLPPRSLAARFAAKEAVAKALGAPPGLRWRDARVRRGEHGAPSLELRGTVAALAHRLGAGAVHLSLSHDAGIATAFVVVERAPAPTGPPSWSPPPGGPRGPTADPTARPGPTADPTAPPVRPGGGRHPDPTAPPAPPTLPPTAPEVP